jgi:hypothetical protein
VKSVTNSHGLPFPIPDLLFLEQYEIMNTFLDSVVEDASNAVVAHCDLCGSH